MNGFTADGRSKWTAYVLGIVRFLIGAMFILHGTQKLWGFPGGGIDRDFTHLHAYAGPIEFIGGAFIIFGLFTRTAAFILCGEMAVAYFSRWAPQGFWPINNGGELSVINCYAFLWLFTAGPGAFSLDTLMKTKKGTPGAETGLAATVAAGEGYVRSILRVIVAFLLSLHGYREVFGLFPPPARRRVLMPLDALPAALGWVLILGGLLLALGLFTRITAFVLWLQMAAAYITFALPHGPNPLRNGGEEVALYFFLFPYFIVAGAGVWSLDHLLAKRRGVSADLATTSSAMRT